MRPDRILQRGLPIRREFWERAIPKAKLRRRLGLDKDAQTVLLMGGGDGVGGLDQIAKEVCKECGKIPAQSQVVAICGNNKKLMHDLSSRTYPDNVKVVVKGFVNNVDEFMGASDCLVTKAGPGTIAEAMTRGLPMVLSSFLPGQEAGNVPYVVDGGFGLSPEAPDKPRKIAKSVRKLLTDDERRTEMGELALGASRPSATKDIARDIGSIVLRQTVEFPKLPLGYKEKHQHPSTTNGKNRKKPRTIYMRQKG
jgi:1,2-diacylglycerol 3-beta-galactosyltransferase